jgi:uncharacterized damage-inducible protein DinB
MTQVPTWYERKFEFMFPAELYPNLYIRLRGSPARLEEMLRSVSGDLGLRKPDGKWSAQEHAGHLVDLEPLWLARVEDFLTDGSTLTVTDLANRKTDAANYNSRNLAEILASFRSARLRLLNRLDQLQLASFTRTMLHPRLQQPMRLIDHLFFVAEHDDHHLAKIWELLNS